MRSSKPWLALRQLPATTVAAIAIALSTLSALPVAQTQRGTSQEHWVGTWSTAPQALLPPDQSSKAQDSPPQRRDGWAPVQINNQTLRQVVHTSIGGSRVRVALTNAFGTGPLRIGAAHVAVRTADSAIVPASGSRLTFGEQPSATIAAGAVLVSDPVDLAVPALGDLAIDLYLPGDSWATRSPATIHADGLTTNYLSPTGNHSGAVEMPVDTTLQSWFFLSRVEVMAVAERGAIITLGDSITDGTASTADTNSRWPDVLARRLLAEHGNGAPAVLNVGIAGNRVLSDNAGLRVLSGDSAEAPNPNAGFGPSAISRFDRDVLLQPGVTHVIVLETINDIGMARDARSPTVAELIAGHRALIQRAHARDLKIYGGTLTPFEGAVYWTEVGEAKRRALNEWIRTSGAYDAVIDFDAAVRDPSNPTRFLAAYHAGDWLHPSDEGYRVMGEAIDLNLFTSDGSP